MMQIDVSNTQDVHEGGFNRVDGEGTFHVVISGIDDSQDEYASVITDLQVLAGTDPNQVGRTHREFFSTSEKAMPRLNRLAMVTDLIAPGQSGNVTFSDAIGRDLVVKLEPNSYKDKEGNERNGVRIGFMDMWKPGHPDVKDCPLGTVPDISDETSFEF